MRKFIFLALLAVMPAALAGGINFGLINAAKKRVDRLGDKVDAEKETIAARQRIINNKAPVLAWTGEAGYASDGVDPEVGGTAVPFFFRVKYSDPDGDSPAPGYPKVHITKSGLDIAGSPFTMSYVSGPAGAGEIYAYSRALSPGGTDYAYYFDGPDSYYAAASGVPTVFVSSPVVVNIPPVLDWTGEAGYVSDGLEPESGNTGTQFVYRVKFSDADNDPPAAGYPRVHLTKGGAEIAGSPFQMTWVSGASSTGAIYRYTGPIAPGGSDYAYYIDARDIVGAAATGVRLTGVGGPAVSNAVSTLSWTGEAGYAAGGLYPGSGTTETSFVYRVKYTDWDNDAPAAGYPAVHVKKGGAEIPGSPFAMAYVSGGYKTGAVYAYPVSLVEGKDYSYFFECKDALNAASLGDPLVERSSPAVTNWKSVSAGGVRTFSVKTDGTVWVWGSGNDGELGLEAVVYTSTPTRAGVEAAWAAVSAGYRHTVAIKTDGTLWAWGVNTNGQLGLGDAVSRSTPTRVGTDSDWASVSAGYSHTMAIKTDGTLWAWGQNLSGGLGVGDKADRDVPTKVGTDTDWGSVSCGALYTRARKTGGTLWVWGGGTGGVLGLGDALDRTSPVQLGSDADWASVSGGDYHTLAVRSGGTLWAWGMNTYGQLGLGNTADRNVPVQVGAAAVWASAYAGSYHSAAIRTDGTLWTWGRNLEGQLGLGDDALRASPVRVGAASNWKEVSGGTSHTLAIRTDGSLWGWGANTGGQGGYFIPFTSYSPLKVGN